MSQISDLQMKVISQVVPYFQETWTFSTWTACLTLVNYVLKGRLQKVHLSSLFLVYVNITLVVIIVHS